MYLLHYTIHDAFVCIHLKFHVAWPVTKKEEVSMTTSHMTTSRTDHLPSPLLCSVDEAASLLGVKRTFVFGLLASKQLPSCRLGRLRKIARADVDNFVECLRSEAGAT